MGGWTPDLSTLSPAAPAWNPDPSTLKPAAGQPSQQAPAQVPTEAQALANPPVAVPSSWHPARDPYSGQSYGSPVPGAVASDLEQRDKTAGTAGQIQNESSTPVTNASLIYAAPTVGESAGKAATRVGEMLHPEAGKQAAGELFDEVSKTVGQHTVQMTDKMASALDEIKQAIDTGGSNPQVVNKFVTRISDLEKGPITYDEARGFYKNLGDFSQTERGALNKNMGRLINNFKQSLGESIKATADAGQKLEQYQGAMTGWAKAATDQAQLEKAKAVIGKYSGRALEGAVGAGGAYALWKELKSIFE